MKSLYLVLGVLILFIAVIFNKSRPVLAVSGVELSLPNNPKMTTWSPVTLTNNSLSKYYFDKGETTTFTGTIANYAYNQNKNVLVSIDIYNGSNQRVARMIKDNINLKPFETKQISMSSPGNLDSGYYYYTVGIYNSGGKGLLGWYPEYQNFTIAK